MKIIRDIAHIFRDEFIDILGDKGILIFIIFVPLVYPLLYSYIYTNEVVRDVPAAVVDDSQTHFSRDFIRRVDACPEVKIIAHATTLVEAEELMKERKIFGIIHIPSSLNKDIYRGEQTHVGLYCNMSSMLYYKSLLLATTNVSLEMNKEIKVSRYISGTTERQDEISKMPIEYDYVPLYNPQSGFASFLIPPVLMLIIQQTLLLGIGMSMGSTREKYLGCIIPFNRDYHNPIEIVMGKAAVYFTIYLFMALYMFTIVTWGFTLPQLGKLSVFMAFIVPYLFSCIFFAMTFSSLIYRREDCILLFVFLSVPLLFLSGVSWPYPTMPRFWKAVSYLFPSTFGMNGYVRITGMGDSLSEIGFEMRGLWVQTILYFGIACLVYDKHIRRMVSKIKHI